MENQETSVGAFIYKIENNEIMFLLVYSKRNSEWGFPKGHIEPNETEIETAKREIKEETGITDLTFVKDFRCCDTYKIKGTLSTTKNRIVDKNVIYYLANTKEDFKGSVDEEIGQHNWLKFEDCIKYLKYEKQKELIRKAFLFLNGGTNESGIEQKSI